RRSLIRRYDARLSAFGPALRPMQRHAGQDAGWHLSVALIDFAGLGRDRGTVMRALRARGIGTQVHYLPVSRQTYYRRRYGEA
ncbi:DegT/DnrJ/EryC1/StrS family aminotransferase, partial [Salmonella enterica]|uniref:DegT/DnrJ/EryC1/StrS family aminotransferase n=1 Tax=Salmonella enterica TaxID=28901 RepID=UPI003D269C65